jgi:uncharacterized protein YigE (DUF2233 family)
LAILLVIGSLGLISAPATVRSQDRTAQRAIASLDPLRLFPHVARLSGARGRSFRLLRWRLPLDRVAIELGRLGRAESLGSALRRTRAALIVNGGFFDSRGRPIGLAVSGGELQSEHSSQIRGGVLVVGGAGRASLHASDGFVLPAGTRFALQSQPRLVVGSRVVPIRGPVRPADRTALCIRAAGRVIDVYVARSRHPRARGGPTLAAFARALQRAGCEDALNLDGGRSTGAAWRENRRSLVLAARAPIHQLIVVRPSPNGGNLAPASD